MVMPMVHQFMNPGDYVNGTGIMVTTVVPVWDAMLILKYPGQRILNHRITAEDSRLWMFQTWEKSRQSTPIRSIDSSMRLLTDSAESSSSSVTFFIHGEHFVDTANLSRYPPSIAFPTTTSASREQAGRPCGSTW